MADVNGVLNRLLTSLSVYDPTWDVSVGSATYKIMESVAQEISSTNNNSVLQTYSYDITTKFGVDLDNFCNLFGVYRQLGQRSSGTVQFTTSSPATNIYDIPIGTQVAVPVNANGSNPIYFATTAPAILAVGDTTVSVPVTSVLAGSFTNVPANSVSMLVNTIMGVTSVNNDSSITGGVDIESDTALRARWQATVFNNVTGTAGKYVYTALQNPNVGLANAIGPQTFYDEQLQINAVISGNTGPVFTLTAYSGMVNPLTGSTYSGNTLVSSSGFAANTTGSALGTALTNWVNSLLPTANALVVSATPTGNTISGGLNINFSTGSPYRLSISGTTGTNGVTTSGNVSYYEYVKSANPDIGASGTLSYNISQNNSGYLFPQGNELVGTSLNTDGQIVYANNFDYIYPGSPTVQLTLTIANQGNNPNLIIGNVVEVISEYTPSCSRAIMPVSGNYADIFINGTTGTNYTEQVSFNSSATLSSGNTNPLLNTINYVMASGASATAGGITGDYYVPLTQQPAINIPSQLSTSTSGVADTIYIYNNSTNSGVNYPIALNPYGYVTFTGTSTNTNLVTQFTTGSSSTVLVSSGNTSLNPTFIAVNNAASFLYPGLAIPSGTTTKSVSSATTGTGTLTLTIPTNTFISSVSSSGVVLNNAPVFTVTNGTVYINSNNSNGVLSINVTTSGKALVYPLYDITDNYGSVQSITGLAFRSTTVPSGWGALPTGSNWGIYSHDYNSDVTEVETLTQQSRPLGVNTLVHQATFMSLAINLSIVYTGGSSQSTINTSIWGQLSQYLSGLNFLSMISFSALSSQVLRVGGVDNVTVTSVQTLAVDGTVINTYTHDFLLASNQLPSLGNINYTVRGYSNF